MPNGTHFLLIVAITIRVMNAMVHVFWPSSLGETEEKLNFQFSTGVILVKPTDDRRS